MYKVLKMKEKLSIFSRILFNKHRAQIMWKKQKSLKMVDLD